MIQRGWCAASVARVSNSVASDGVQPGFQYSASSDTIGMPVIADSRCANVDLPDPDDPMTRIRCMIRTRYQRARAARAACSLAKSSPAWCEERVSGLADTIRNPLV